MLLSINKVSNWNHHLKLKLTAFPDVGILLLTPFILLPPTVNDLIAGTTVRKYHFQTNHPADLTESRLNNFIKAL